MSRRRNINRTPARSNKSTNFNTDHMKVAFFDVEEERSVHPFDGVSFNKLRESIDFGLARADKKECVVQQFVVINPSMVFGPDDERLLANHAKFREAVLLSFTSSVLVLESKQGFLLTIVIVGGAHYVPDRQLAAKPSTKKSKEAKMSESSDSEQSQYKDATGMNLTQECKDLF